MNERIGCAALLLEELKIIITGLDHEACYKLVDARVGDVAVTVKQGFATLEGRFVDRFEAFEIAVKSGQVKDRGETGADRMLISEMLNFPPKE
jgi:phage terminase large subunit-like protein